MIDAGPKFSRRAALLAPAGLAATSSLGVKATAGADAGRPFSRQNFGTVGVFDIDWLLQPEFTHLLDNFAASPGAFHGVRFFGAFTAGRLEDFIPSGGGSVWVDPIRAPDFSITFRALEALTSRGLTPFVSLGFFPPAVSPSPIAPPPAWARWRQLVGAFFNSLAGDPRFGAEAIKTWRFEVWNEPNEGRFWSGSVDDYLDLYRATSEAIDATGLTVSLGGPAIAYKPEVTPAAGPPWIDRFLRFISANPSLRCDFISQHRKGTVIENPPDPRRLFAAARATATQALAIDRTRFAGITIVNDEADEKVGFEVPYAPRMDERNASWLTAVLALHIALEDQFRDDGVRFAAFADNADLQLVQAPFDGRRAIMTRANANSATDLLKVPAYGFYELLRLLGERRIAPLAGETRFSPTTDLYHLATSSDDAVTALLTYYPDPNAPVEAERSIDYALTGIPWAHVNIALFQIDARRSNGYAAAGGSADNPFPIPDPAAIPMVRLAQEIALARPIARKVSVEGGVYRETLALALYTTLCLWVTPVLPDTPAAPSWFEIVQEGSNVILRWEPNIDRYLVGYEIFVMLDGVPAERLSPNPLRAAFWIDTNPPPGPRGYGVRAVSASGETSAWKVATKA